jgi:hypothetical protein
MHRERKCKDVKSLGFLILQTIKIYPQENHRSNTLSVVLKKVKKLDLVAHTYNPSYLEGGDWGGLQFKANQGKRFARLHLNQ